MSIKLLPECHRCKRFLNLTEVIAYKFIEFLVAKHLINNMPPTCQDCMNEIDGLEYIQNKYWVKC